MNRVKTSNIIFKIFVFLLMMQAAVLTMKGTMWDDSILVYLLIPFLIAL